MRTAALSRLCGQAPPSSPAPRFFSFFLRTTSWMSCAACHWSAMSQRACARCSSVSSGNTGDSEIDQTHLAPALHSLDTHRRVLVPCLRGMTDGGLQDSLSRAGGVGSGHTCKRRRHGIRQLWTHRVPRFVHHAVRWGAERHCGRARRLEQRRSRAAKDSTRPKPGPKPAGRQAQPLPTRAACGRGALTRAQATGQVTSLPKT